MRRFLTLFALLFATAAFGLPLHAAAPTKAKVEWVENYDKGLELAKSEKKPVFVLFTGSDWCGFCKKLKKEVLDSPQWQEAVGDRFVYVVIDDPVGKPLTEEQRQQKDRLYKKYAVKGLPTVVILDASGKEIGRPQYQALDRPLEERRQEFIDRVNSITGS